MKNKGAAGVDGMKTEELPSFLKEHWIEIKDQLLNGTYKANQVKRVYIPKSGSTEMRPLGIPTVMERFLQQAVLQILQGKWDKTFSESSFGFRPGRSAHMAVIKAQSFILEGYDTVVDIDLEKFFDKVCHDKLMSKLPREIADKRLLKLIRRWLRAGILDKGLVSIPDSGTPQGGPLSPFLSNIVLDELDKELEKRGHRFVRYADDQNIYVKSERAAKRIMKSISNFISTRLKLKVNEKKSAIGRPEERQFLGFTFLSTLKGKYRIRVANKSITKFKDKVRILTKRSKKNSLDVKIEKLNQLIQGWKGYFGLSQIKYEFDQLDKWIRRRLRCVLWKDWKIPKRRIAELRKRGIKDDVAIPIACSSKGAWRISASPPLNKALPKAFFKKVGLKTLYS
jgi:RNA-directed DNA polymerase